MEGGNKVVGVCVFRLKIEVKEQIWGWARNLKSMEKAKLAIGPSTLALECLGLLPLWFVKVYWLINSMGKAYWVKCEPLVDPLLGLRHGLQTIAIPICRCYPILASNRQKVSSLPRSPFQSIYHYELIFSNVLSRPATVETSNALSNAFQRRGLAIDLHRRIFVKTSLDLHKSDEEDIN
nr:hypothetical protein Iba_chr12bCG17550 [Ipomoea batatas]